MKNSQGKNTEALFAIEMAEDSGNCFFAFGVGKDCNKGVRCWRTVLYLLSSGEGTRSAPLTI